MPQPGEHSNRRSVAPASSSRLPLRFASRIRLRSWPVAVTALVEFPRVCRGAEGRRFIRASSTVTVAGERGKPLEYRSPLGVRAMRMRATGLVVSMGLAVAVVGCGSNTTTTPATVGASTTGSGPATGSPSTDAHITSAPLPDPCSLVTATDVGSFFDNAETASSSTTNPSRGRSTCLYNLRTGSQGRQVGVSALNDFDKNNPSYGYPPPTLTISGLGDSAVLATTNKTVRQVTVKVGTNAIEISVDFYDKPVDDAFVTRLAKTAVSRI